MFTPHLFFFGFFNPSIVTLNTGACSVMDSSFDIVPVSDEQRPYSINEYDIGSSVQLSAAFFNNAGILADPTAIALRVKDPTGTVTVYTGAQVTRQEAGIYSLNLALAHPGRYFYRFEGTGGVLAAADNMLFVRKSPVLN